MIRYQGRGHTIYERQYPRNYRKGTPPMITLAKHTQGTTEVSNLILSGPIVKSDHQCVTIKVERVIGAESKIDYTSVWHPVSVTVPKILCDLYIR